MTPAKIAPPDQGAPSVGNSGPASQSQKQRGDQETQGRKQGNPRMPACKGRIRGQPHHPKRQHAKRQGMHHHGQSRQLRPMQAEQLNLRQRRRADRPERYPCRMAQQRQRHRPDRCEAQADQQRGLASATGVPNPAAPSMNSPKNHAISKA